MFHLLQKLFTVTMKCNLDNKFHPFQMFNLPHFHCAKMFPLINNYSLFMHSSPKVFTTINTFSVYMDLHVWLAHINPEASDLLLLFPIGIMFSRFIHFVVRQYSMSSHQCFIYYETALCWTDIPHLFIRSLIAAHMDGSFPVGVLQISTFWFLCRCLYISLCAGCVVMSHGNSMSNIFEEPSNCLKSINTV